MKPPLILLAPGAGAPSTSPWMAAWRQRLGAMRVGDEPVREVIAFDYPYRREGRKAPDKQPVLVAAHLQALHDLAARAPGAPLVLAGKSMGGRIGCHVAALHPELVAAVVCLGYPLRAAGSGALRDQVLLELRRPILFVQGSRDPMCPLERLAEVRARMAAPSRLHVVEGGNHSLELPAKDRARQPAVDAEVAGVIRVFLETVL